MISPSVVKGPFSNRRKDLRRIGFKVYKASGLQGAWGLGPRS